MPKGTGGSNPSLSASIPMESIQPGEVPKFGWRGSPAKGVGRVYRREGSNPSFSAKKPENAEFSGFFDALNLLLLQMPKK